VPAVINLSLVLLARALYPRPQDMETSPPTIGGSHFPRVFWIYLLGAILVAAGFADYPLIAFHFSRAETVPGDWIAIFYAVAMAVSGTGSLILGRLFDRFGFVVLVVLTLVSALFAPLVFLGGFWIALLGAAIWGLGMGVHESIIPAAVAPMVPSPAQRLRLRLVHGRLRRILVPRKCGDWNSLRPFASGGDRVLRRHSSRGRADFYLGRP
jgi:predicted MFS family arabinose efflux permease